MGDNCGGLSVRSCVVQLVIIAALLNQLLIMLRELRQLILTGHTGSESGAKSVAQRTWRLREQHGVVG